MMVPFDLLTNKNLLHLGGNAAVNLTFLHNVSSLQSPVTFPFTLIVFSPIFMQDEKQSPCSKNTPVIFPNPGISISHCSPSFIMFSPGMNFELLLVEILPPPSLFISTTSMAANISLFIGSGTPQASRYPSAPTLEHTFQVPSKSPSLL